MFSLSCFWHQSAHCQFAVDLQTLDLGKIALRER